MTLVCHVRQVSAELGSSFNDVIAAQDVALYGGLCALASFDRPDLRRHIVDNISFRELLELNPEVWPRAFSWLVMLQMRAISP